MLISAVTAKFWKLKRAAFGPPPFHHKKRLMYLSSFLELLILTICSSFENTVYKYH